LVETADTISLSSMVTLSKGECHGFQDSDAKQNRVWMANVDGKTWVYKYQSSIASVREFFYHHFAVLSGFHNLHFELVVKGENDHRDLIHVLTGCEKKNTISSKLLEFATEAKVILRLALVDPLYTLPELPQTQVPHYFHSIGAYSAFMTVTTASDKFPYPEVKFDFKNVKISLGEKKGDTFAGLQNTFVSNGGVLPLDIDTASPTYQVLDPVNYCHHLTAAYKHKIAEAVCSPESSSYAKVLEEYLHHNSLIASKSKTTRDDLGDGAKQEFQRISQIDPAAVEDIVIRFKERHPQFDVVMKDMDHVMMGDNPPGVEYLKCWIDFLKTKIRYKKKTMCIAENCCIN